MWVEPDKKCYYCNGHIESYKISYFRGKTKYHQSCRKVHKFLGKDYLPTFKHILRFYKEVFDKCSAQRNESQDIYLLALFYRKYKSTTAITLPVNILLENFMPFINFIYNISPSDQNMAKKILVNILILINNLIQKYDLRVDILVSIDIKWWNNVHCEVFLNNSLPVEVFYYNREIEEINPLELTSVVDLDYEGVKTVLFHIPSILTIIFNEITDKNEFFNLFSGIPLLKCNNYSICLDKLISKANKL